MNELEKLSKEHQKNYLRYLKRMTLSMKVSTKGLIPMMCSNSKNILDVGCGSGVLLNAIEEVNREAKLTGIDLNGEAIDKLKVLGKNWQLLHTDLMQMKGAYDTIVFSSVLHEISSYYSDLNKRFTSFPIEESIRKANELLMMDGSIILRDGLLMEEEKRNQLILTSFTNKDDALWLYRFRNDFKGFVGLNNVSREFIKIDDRLYLVPFTFLKEFLYTFTWGIESYPREVQEQFGILDKNSWISILENNGFTIETIVESKEEYEKYLSPKIQMYDILGNKINYPMMVILIKARKNKTLEKRK